MLFENLSIVNKNMRDTNSNPEEIYETVRRKSVTKGNEKSRTEINCEKRYETLYLLDSGHGNITERTDGTSIADEEFCFDKKKRMRKGKQCTPRKKYPKPTTQPKFDKNIFSSINTLIPTVMLSTTLKICFSKEEKHHLKK